jgi:ribokinase
VIVVFGSINVDMTIPVADLPGPGETVLGPSYQLVPGGKGANQALAAARAGAQVKMVGKTGRDSMADVALRELRRGGVDLQLTKPDDQPTGCAMICVDRAGRNMIVVASGANLSAIEHQVPDELLVPGSVVVLQMEVWPSQNWALVARAAARGARVLLNAAPAGPIPGIALAALDWLIVNEYEVVTVAAALGLGALPPRQAARVIARAADITVIATLGSAGAVAYGPEGDWEIGVLPIVPVDSTAAGDAFVGAFAAAIDAGSDLPTALTEASIAGGLACLQTGAQTSLPDRSAIRSRLGDLAPPRQLPEEGR